MTQIERAGLLARTARSHTGDHWHDDCIDGTDEGNDHCDDGAMLFARTARSHTGSLMMHMWP